MTALRTSRARHDRGEEEGDDYADQNAVAPGLHPIELVDGILTRRAQVSVLGVEQHTQGIEFGLAALGRLGVEDLRRSRRDRGDERVHIRGAPGRRGPFDGIQIIDQLRPIGDVIPDLLSCSMFGLQSNEIRIQELAISRDRIAADGCFLVPQCGL